MKLFVVSIPVIDLRVPSSHAARQIHRACTDVGFFAIAGHGVPHSVIEQAWAQTTAFFDLAMSQKMAARHSDTNHPYGYFPAGEALARSRGVDTPPDLKESFNLAPPSSHDDGTGRFGGVERIWPDEAPGFRQAWEAYYLAMVQLADRLMALFAVALGVEPVHFTSRTGRHLSALRGLNYPPLEARPEHTQLRAGAHSDYGTLTILLPGPGAGGLEVQTAAGAWLPVDPIAGSFVVNVGDMMQLWTNDRWRSTLHRVALPQDHAERRQSLAFFHQPDWDAEITTLPSCIDSEHPQKHEPVIAGPWLRAKFDRASGRG
ncbi:MAG: isopenicillin N synthase family dioxygenase [Acidimicrobiales bacterium]